MFLFSFFCVNITDQKQDTTNIIIKDCTSNTNGFHYLHFNDKTTELSIQQLNTFMANNPQIVCPKDVLARIRKIIFCAKNEEEDFNKQKSTKLFDVKNKINTKINFQLFWLLCLSLLLSILTILFFIINQKVKKNYLNLF